MAVAYLASSYASAFSVDSSTTSWSYDSLATGSDRCLVVAVTYENNTTPADITSVTYNSVAMTHQVTFIDDGGGFSESTEIWTLAAPATGSNTLAFTISQTGRDLGFAASVFTGVDQTTPVGNTAVSAQYISNTTINADLLFASNSMGVYNSFQNRSNTGPFTARTSNTQLGSYLTASGNSGFESAMGYRGPEASAATYNCGSDATTTSVGGGCAAIELLEATGGASVTGTIAQTLADIISTASGVVPYTGTINSTLEELTSSASGNLTVLGSLSETLDDATSAASGLITVSGASNNLLLDVTSAASGLLTVSGAIAQTIEDFTGAASGVSGGGVSGSIAITLADVISTASGVVPYTGTISETLENVTSSGVGTITVSGSISETLENTTSAASGLLTVTGTITELLDNTVSSFAGSVTVTGTINEALDDVLSAASGSVFLDVTGSINSVLEAFSASGSGSVVVDYITPKHQMVLKIEARTMNIQTEDRIMKVKIQ